MKSKRYACSSRETAPKVDIKVGSIIFLYNPETDVLLGPFTALTEGAETVDNGAWAEDIDDHSASQNVKLEWESLHVLAKAGEMMPFLKAPKTCELTTTQTQRALDLLKQAPLHSKTE